MKQEIELFIHERKHDHMVRPEFFMATDDYECIDGYILLGKTKVSIDIPEVDTRSIRVEKLKAEKQKILADNERRLNEVDDKINRLLAIDVDNALDEKLAEFRQEAFDVRQQQALEEDEND